MAAKEKHSFNEIMSDLKARRFSPIYILMGDEAYYIDRIAEYIEENVLTPEERDFNQTVVFGSDITASQVADMARRYPMMAEHQVVIVKEAQNVKSLEALEKYLKSPVKTTILVWCHKNGTIDRRKKVISLADSAGVVYESKKLSDRQLPTFIEDYIKSKNATIERKATAMVADHVGADLHRLVSELDKLFVGMNDGNRTVTPDLVEQKIGVSKEYNPFEMRNAIVAKNILKANQIINYFEKNPKSGSLYAFLPIVFGFFQNLMIVHYLPQKDEATICRVLGIKWASEYMTGLRNYSAMKTMNIIGKIREIDARSKGLDSTGNTSVGDLMKELVFFILH